ncbi:MAG: hypothetical protein ACFN3A_02025 [Candidatus Nanosyncoccus sp.]
MPVNSTETRKADKDPLKPYREIIDFPHFHAPNRPYLSHTKRATQFMPFKSLDVYEDQIEQKFHQLHNQKLDPIIDYDDDYEIS